MARRTADDLRSHLSVFQEGYPILKGYIARLLFLDGCSVPDVVRKVKSIVETNDPGKIINEGSICSNLYTFKKLVNERKRHMLTRDWASLITLFQQPLPIIFKSLPVTSTSSQVGDKSLEPASSAPVTIPSMSECTWTADHLRSHLSVFEEGYPLQKGYIARLLFVDGCSVPDVVRKVKTIVETNDPGKNINEKSLYASLYTFKKLVNEKRRHRLTRDWPSLITLFLQPLPIIFKSFPVAFTSSQVGDTSLEPALSAPVIAPSISECSSLPSPKKLTRYCASCVNKQRTILNLSGKIRQLKEQVRHLKTASPKQFSLKRLNAKIKRKTESAEAWKQKYVAMKERCEDAEIKLRQLGPLRQRITELEMELENSLDEKKKLVKRNKQLVKLRAKSEEKTERQKKKLNDFKKTAAIERQKIKKQHEKQIRELKKTFAETHAAYENEISLLQEEAEDDDKELRIIQTKKKGTYNEMVRLCVYNLVLHNVSVRNVSNLLSSIGQSFFARSISDLPSASTVARMAVEIGVLAEVQVGYVLDHCKSATLGWDSTTKGGLHINEVHVAVLMEDGRKLPLTISLSYLSGGATDNIYDDISQSLSDICDMYICAFDLTESEEVRKRIFKKIRSSMSDRAPVNHCVHDKLKEKLGDFVELKCSVHPLDGLATAARKCLHQRDVQEKRCPEDQPPALGCRAANVIYQVSRLRFKDGSGDPLAFMVFLKRHNIPPGIILRYVGNRLNMMFHMAAILHTHRSAFVEFMTARRTRDLCNRILIGLTDPIIQVQLQVLALFSKYLTGPWMRFFYEREGGPGYQFGAVEFQPCIQRLKALHDEPEDLINTTTDVFGKEMRDVQPDLRRLEMATKNEFLETVKTLTECFINTLTRQLGDSAHECGESSEMTEATASAPMHNMHAERVLGMMDALMRRAPIARLGFNAAKVRAHKNETLQWLRSFSEDQQEKLVHFAMEQEPVVSRRMFDRKKVMENAVHKKYEKDRREFFQKELRTEADSQGLNATLLDLDMFRQLTIETKQRLKDFIVDNKVLSAVLLRHVWEYEGQDRVYLEMIRDVNTHKLRGKVSTEINLWCWNQAGIPSDDSSSIVMDSFSMDMIEFLVDFAVLDLSFM